MIRLIVTGFLASALLIAGAVPASAEGAGQVKAKGTSGEWKLRAKLKVDDERNAVGKVDLRRDSDSSSRRCRFTAFQAAFTHVNLAGFHADGSCSTDGGTPSPVRLDVFLTDNGKGNEALDSARWTMSGPADLAIGSGAMTRGNVKVKSKTTSAQRHDQGVRELYRDSKSTPDLNIVDGFPADAELDIAVKGDDAVERAVNFLETYKQAYYLADASILLGVRRVYSDAGADAVQFYQTWNGIPVYAGDLTVQLRGNRVIATSGSLLIPPVRVNAQPTLSREDAEDAARTHLGAWSITPALGETALMVHDYALEDAGPRDPHLIWRVMIGTPTPQQVLVDAHSGAIRSTTHLDSEAFDLDLYTVNNQTNGGENGCYAFSVEDDFIGDESGVTDPAFQSDPDATGAHTYFSAAYDFFKDSYGLDSYDNAGNNLEVFVHVRITDEDDNVTPNARFMRCSYGVAVDEIFEFTDNRVYQDIVTHEYTHGVNYYGADFNSGGTPGAMNESLADIQAFVQSDDHRFGEGTGTVLRSLQFPSRNHINAWYYGTVDNGGVHTNAGVTNHAAWLFAKGGVHSFTDVYVKPPTDPGERLGIVGKVFHHASMTMPSGGGPSAMRNATLARLKTLSLDASVKEEADCALRNAFGAIGIGSTDVACSGPNPDPDGDGVPSNKDNCYDVWNASQDNVDGDAAGDACDGDIDGDGIVNDPDPPYYLVGDNCDYDFNPTQSDVNVNGIGSECDPLEDMDIDDDGIYDWDDNCLFDYNPSQADIDLDNWGDVCDPDNDGDAVTTDEDNCPGTVNADQADTDGDKLGDACDLCPNHPDTSIAWSYFGTPGSTGGTFKAIVPDSDGDGIPDACDFGLIGHATVSGFERTPGLLPDGQPRSVVLQGLPGEVGVIPVPVCINDCALAPVADSCVKVSLTGLPANVHAFVSDDRGLPVARAPKVDPNRQLQLQPRGGRRYQLNLVLGDGFPGSANFSVSASGCN
jgi:Zn-dependent metalloprotease